MEAEHYGDNFKPVIVTEDEPSHTDAHPFCWDMTCPCHDNQEAIAEVATYVTDGLASVDDANHNFQGKTV